MPPQPASSADIREDLRLKQERENELNEAAKLVGTVIFVGTDYAGATRAVVRSGATIMDVSHAQKIKAGDSVLLHPKTGQIVARGYMPMMGAVVGVTRVIDDHMVEVEGHAGPSVALRGHDGLKIEVGHRVALDSSGSVIVADLGKPASEYERGESGVDWDSIGGLADAKQLLSEAIEHPAMFPELYAQYGQRPSHGVLLLGPPGCGKTLMAKASATAIARQHGADTEKGLGTGFLYVKGPEVLSKWVGEAERTIREIFARARSHKKERGYPAVLFIDEADALLSKRGSGVSSDMEKTIVPMFLSEMDGLDDAAAIVVLATNRADQLDPAITRDGRIDTKVRISRPDRDATAEIIAINLRGKMVSEDTDTMADAVADEIFREDRVLSSHEKGRSVVDVLLSDLVSGAMAANVVTTAMQLAIRRDIAAVASSRRSKPRASGITLDDLLRAVDQVQDQNKHINHDEVLEEVIAAGRTRAKESPRRSAGAA